MRKPIVFLLAMLFMLGFCLSVSASSEPIELNKKGSLTVTMSCVHGNKSDGNIALYRIANVIWTGNNYAFEFTEEFADCNIPLHNIGGDMAAKDFNEYVIANQISVDRHILVDGTVVINDLPMGLYMVVHEEPTDGFSAALPFLVTVPVSEGDGWDYSVDASPKIELQHFDVITPPDIPQTGQLKWPIPVLAISGVIVFAIGWVLCRKSRCK